jgi:amidase
VRAGLKLRALDIAAAEQKRQEVYHRFRLLFERFDILLTPAAPVKPFPLEMNFPDQLNGQKFENYIDWIAPAFLITLASLPAASAPAGLARDGLPVGIQIVAPRFEEPRILSLAGLIQRQSGVGWPPASTANSGAL